MRLLIGGSSLPLLIQLLSAQVRPSERAPVSCRPGDFFARRQPSVFALVVALLVLVSTASAQVPEVPGRTDPAAGLLKRARLALGGEENLAGIKSLLVEGTRTREPESEYAEQDPWGFRLLLPDRYQSLDSDFRHTIDAGAFWMDERAGNPLAAPLQLSPAIRATAERQTRFSFAHSCIVFLLTSPPLFKGEVRYLGALPDDAAKRDWLEIRAAGFRFQIGFDAATGLPRDIRTETNNGVRTESLYDFKSVDGVMFPFAINEKSGPYHSVVDITSVKVNAGVTSADFKKK